MAHSNTDLAFSPSVKAVQERMGSRAAYQKVEARGGWSTTIDADLRAFLAEQNAFFLASASAAGQPYVQHRGGPRGFVKVLDDHTLAFADYPGNRQYITVGNLAENDRVVLFFLDHRNRRRVKVWGRARVIEAEEDSITLSRVADAQYPARRERAILVQVEAWDLNCPQHIPRRIDEEDLVPMLEELRERIEQLEAENERLRRAAAESG